MRSDKSKAGILTAVVAAATLPSVAVPFFTERPLSGFFTGWALMHGSLVFLGACSAAAFAVYAAVFFLLVGMFRVIRGLRQ